MLENKDYCDYETCVALKELGITDWSLQYYEKGCPNTLHRNLFQPLTIRTAEALGRVLAISLYYAQKWLREEKKIEIVVHSFDYVGEPYFADIHMYREVRCACSYADSYEEALSKGIKEAVEILKDGIGE